MFINIQGVHFHKNDHNFSSQFKKAIPVSANNVIQPNDRIVQNHSFSFSRMELNFLCKETSVQQHEIHNTLLFDLQRQIA